MREQCRALEDGPRRDVNAERLDHYTCVLECLTDRVAIESITRHLIQARILDWYTCRRPRQGTNIVAGAKRGFYRFKSNATAGANDKDLGRVYSLANLMFVFSRRIAK